MKDSDILQTYLEVSQNIIGNRKTISCQILYDTSEIQLTRRLDLETGKSYNIIFNYKPEELGNKANKKELQTSIERHVCQLFIRLMDL